MVLPRQRHAERDQPIPAASCGSVRYALSSLLGATLLADLAAAAIGQLS